MDRTHPLTTAPAGRWSRTAVLVGVAVAGGVVGAVVALVVGVLLQPSFTELEQAAIRLVPDGWDAQPPVELVDAFGAFDRAYRVDVAADDLAPTALVERAERLGWSVGESGDILQLQRDGVRAHVVLGPDIGAITTSISSTVRRAQRFGVLAGVALGAVVAMWALQSRWRRHPRLRPLAGGGDGGAGS